MADQQNIEEPTMEPLPTSEDPEVQQVEEANVGRTAAAAAEVLPPPGAARD